MTEKPGIPKAKKKKEPWREVTKELQQMPVKSQNFTGIIIGTRDSPLLRLGFTTTVMGSVMTKGMPVLVPMSGDLKGAPEFIIKMTNKEMRCWVRGERKRVIVPS